MKPLGINNVESYQNLEGMFNRSTPKGADATDDGKSELKEYKLPIMDVQKERRNFEGVDKNQWYNLGELQSGDYAGTTDTDSQTDDRKGGNGYTPINKKSGKGGRAWKSSSKRTKEN